MNDVCTKAVDRLAAIAVSMAVLVLAFGAAADASERYSTHPGPPPKGHAGASSEFVMTSEVNAAAWDKLEDVMVNVYAHRDRLVGSWPQHLGGYRADALSADSRDRFAAVAAEALSAARDLHLWLSVGGGRVQPFAPDRARNHDEGLLRISVPNLEVRSRAVASAVIVREKVPSIGYVAIAEWPPDAAGVQPALDFVCALTGQGIARLIVDVRSNEGGAEATARRFARLFVRESTVYAQHRYRDRRAPGGWGRWRKRTIDSAQSRTGRAPSFDGTVVVLQGARCVSATESFLLMMRHGGRAKLIGETSGGSSGNPKPIDLGNGVVIYVLTWETRHPDGTALEGRGVVPDVEVQWTPKTVSQEDPLIAAALRILSE